MNEVNELLNRLGELEDAPLIWINKKVYDMDQEIKRLKEEYIMLQNASDEVEEEKDREIERLQDLCNKYEKEHKTTYEIWKKDIYLYNSLVDRIDKAIEYMNYTFNISSVKEMYEIMNELEKILQGVDKE